MRILSFGYDRQLMSLRSMVLRTAGYDVLEVYSQSDAMRLATSNAVDILLICHTVPKQDQCSLTVWTREWRPDMPILCIIANDFAMAADGCLAVDNAPVLLLDAVNRAAAGSSGFSSDIAV
ncbi:MAG TPA: hypothetical protein VGJ33_15330 [Candidatus Angelobacter sp.]|jgi:DNA-binding response OmpR family regulator